jgi:hypothetical protein
VLFILRWEITQSVRKAAIKRFLETGGAPPDGVKMLGRWHTVDGEYGFAIAEVTDLQALSRWTLAWNDLLRMDARPALTDEGMGAALMAMPA